MIAIYVIGVIEPTAPHDIIEALRKSVTICGNDRGESLRKKKGVFMFRDKAGNLAVGKLVGSIVVLVLALIILGVSVYEGLLGQPG